MAKLELSEEARTGVEAGPADLLIVVAVPVDAAALREAATHSVMSLAGNSAPPRTVVAFPGVSGGDVPGGAAANDDTGEGIRFLPYATSAGSPSPIPWLAMASSYQSVFALARELGVSACAVIGFDLAALKSNFLSPMLSPVLEQRCDLAMPLYAQGKFDGLLNSSILAPLSRALYGRRVRFPLAPDFCVSAKLIPDFEAALQRSITQGQTLFWPATAAALREAPICQVHVDTWHASAGDVDLSTALAQTVGPLFGDMMDNASLWQRVRGSQPAVLSGIASPPPPEGPPANTSPMLETFQLGFRNLQEVWSLVLPPVTLLDLKRLARVAPDRFRMPDELWVRIIYDFALAYRLRTLSRTHLLGALAPLYLGWVASYALEVGNAGLSEVDQRLDKLARAFEDGKPYLLSRWRWPDRFNP